VNPKIGVGILTVSDRSARGERADESGPLLRQIARQNGWTVEREGVVPDDSPSIQATLRDWVDRAHLDLILTTGGTGFAPRDVTPEATRAVIEREAPGLAEAMRTASLLKTPHAMLSRAVCGIRGRTLIVNLPGSPTSVRENLETILPALPHAVALLQESPGSERGHQAPNLTSRISNPK
jgi:molybdopterin adenylyltransferase